MLMPILTTHDNLMLLRNTVTNENRIVNMASTQIINDIWNLYAQVYEMGDDALDRLANCKAYSKWLDAHMSDEYLASASAFTLEMIRSELELVVNSLEFQLEY